jgi:GntR family transcriptional regulator of arabinose operon
MNEQKVKANRLYYDLRSNILDGTMPEGRMLPSESDLIETYGLSRYAVRKVLSRLTEENLIRKLQGKGCFVCPIPIQSQVAKLSRQILLIASRAEQFYFLKSINGIERALQNSGFSLTIKLSNYNAEQEAVLLKEAFRDHYAGLLIFPSDSAFIHTNLYLYKYLEEQQIPCILMGNRVPFVNLPYVLADDYLGGNLAANYFLQKGHTSFACIMNREEYSGCMRYAGFVGALNSHESGYKRQTIFWFGHSEQESIFTKRESELLQLADSTTAFFCFNDSCAVNLYQLLVKHGIRVPQDASIIGYDDSYISETNDVPLTTLHQDPEKAGFAAATNLIHLIHDRTYPCNKVFLPYLVERSSVADRTVPEEKA